VVLKFERNSDSPRHDELARQIERSDMARVTEGVAIHLGGQLKVHS